MVKSLLKSGALSNSFEAYAVCTLQDCKDLFLQKPVVCIALVELMLRIHILLPEV